MEESLIMKRLKIVDKELHSVMNELEKKPSRVSPKEIRELLASRVKYDVDTTKLIREMREKEYNL